MESEAESRTPISLTSVNKLDQVRPSVVVKNNWP